MTKQNTDQPSLSCAEQLRLALSEGRTPQVWLAMAHVVECPRCLAGLEEVAGLLEEAKANLPEGEKIPDRLRDQIIAGVRAIESQSEEQ